MLKKFIGLAPFALLLPILAGCVPASRRVSSTAAGTPFVGHGATADLTRGWVQTALPTTATATPAPLASPTRLPATSVSTAAWQSFTSPTYHYTISYPSDWNVTVENRGSVGEAVQVERVVFKEPNYGSPNQRTPVTIETAQHGYSTTGQCQGQTEIIPGIQGCRRSLPQAQGPSQELVWFQSPASGQTPLYFYVQLVYDDLKYVTTFAHMLTTFKHAGAPVTATPQGQDACTYRATFVSDVTVPDNMVVAPGAKFVKTWRVRNEGTCTWGYKTALHRLVFVGGDPLGAPASLELPFPQLGQGGTVDISVPMVATLAPGTYQSNWRLLVDSGAQVGVGPNGDAPLYARIIVSSTATPAAAPSQAFKTFTSSKHHYTVNYPAGWTIDVQSFVPPGPGRDPEGVYLRPPNATWATVQIYALKGGPPIQGDDNCTQNLTFGGVQACSILMPQDPVPHNQLIFQKGESYYHLEGWNTSPGQLGVFEDIVKSFQFTQ